MSRFDKRPSGVSDSTQSAPRVVIPPLASHTRKALSAGCTNPQFRQKRKRSRSPAGPRRLGDSDAHKRVAVPKALCVLREHPRPRPKSGKVRRSDTRPGDVRERAERSEGSDSAPIRNRPVFRRVCPCVRSFCAKTSVYPLSPVKANVGRLCEKLKNAMKSGLEQRYSGNFLAIFAGTVLSEKPNFTGRFFEWQRPFDFSTR